MSFNWKDTLKKIAPLAATMVGGPFGGLAVSAIGAVFGDDAMTETGMATAIRNATPEQIVSLKQIDANLKIKLRELDITEDQLVYDDKDSARDMQKNVQSAMPGALALILTFGFFGALFALMNVEIPEANKSVIYLMLGSLGTAWVGATQFYFGTTKGSADKNSLLKAK